MTSAYISKLDLKIRFIDIRVQKIDKSTFETFKIVIASLKVENGLRKECFF